MSRYIVSKSLRDLAAFADAVDYEIEKGLPSYARQLQRSGKLVAGQVEGGLGQSALGNKIASNKLGRMASRQIAGGPAVPLGQGPNGVGEVIRTGRQWSTKYVTSGKLGGRPSKIDPTTSVRESAKRIRAKRVGLMRERQVGRYAPNYNVLP